MYGRPTRTVTLEKSFPHHRTRINADSKIYYIHDHTDNSILWDTSSCSDEFLHESLVSNHQNHYSMCATFWADATRVPDGFVQPSQMIDSAPMTISRLQFWLLVFNTHEAARSIANYEDGFSLAAQKKVHLIKQLMLNRSSLTVEQLRDNEIIQLHRSFQEVQVAVPFSMTMFMVPSYSIITNVIIKQLFGLYLAYQMMNTTPATTKSVRMAGLSADSPLLPNLQEGIDEYTNWFPTVDELMESVSDDLLIRKRVELFLSRIPPLMWCSLVASPTASTWLQGLELFFHQTIIDSGWIDVLYEDMMFSLIGNRYFLPHQFERREVSAINKVIYIDPERRESDSFVTVRATVDIWKSLMGIDKTKTDMTDMKFCEQVVRSIYMALVLLDRPKRRNSSTTIPAPPLQESKKIAESNAYRSYYPYTAVWFDPANSHHTVNVSTYFLNGFPTFAFPADVFEDFIKDLNQRMHDTTGQINIM